MSMAGQLNVKTNFRKLLFRKYSDKNVYYTGFILTWVFIGAWYGVKMKFILWGFLIGLLLLNEKLFLEKLIRKQYIAGIVYTALISQFLWVLFFSQNLTQAGAYWKAMFGFGNGILDRTGIYFLVSYIALILTGFYIATDLFRNITERMSISDFGQKFMNFMPLVHSVLFICCLACMLYGGQSAHLWLWM